MESSNVVLPFVLGPLEWKLLWGVLGVAILGILYGLVLIVIVYRAHAGTEKMRKIARAIRHGAYVFLRRQFTFISLFIVLITVVLYFTALGDPHIAFGRAVAFLMGSIFSAAIGAIGMSLAVRGNVRTAYAAQTSFERALTIAFQTGTVAGMFTVGLGLLGASIIFMIYQGQAQQVLIGFAFGGSLIALFMRVGGGIFTKAADVGADLVGKVEAGIPEDDPRNPATIADNVGDNVGDCAGMAADLFESYEVTLVAAMILGAAVFPGSAVGVIYPLLVRALGVFTSIIGSLFVRAGKGTKDAMAAINRGFLTAAVLSIIGFYFLVQWYVHDMRIFWATTIGMILAIVISKLTEYFTSTKQKPVIEIAEATQTGPATTILSGFAVGAESTVWAIVAIAVTIVLCSTIMGGNTLMTLYAIALAGMGMLTTTGMIVAMDTYGPVADNAHGIIEMSGEKVGDASNIVSQLDAVGNTTKAITKGFAIGSAVVAAVSLFGSYIESISGSGITSIAVDRPMVFVGLLIGGAVPFLFSSLTIRAVARAAFGIVKEVRRQFREIPGLMEGKADPDSDRCVDICTTAAMRELIGPGLLAILTPVLVGFFLHAEALGGFLAGLILTGQLMAVLLSNAGGAWDNAKKLVEDGGYGGKGSKAHEAAVIGDTVGDPFKDTAGPALNPLIKVMNLVSLLIAPIIAAQAQIPWWMTGMAVAALLIVLAAIWHSKRDPFEERKKLQLD